MSTAISEPLNVKPPVYKQALAGLIVGAMFGPLVGWFIGTFAILFTSVQMTNTNGAMRTSAFVGGLIGIPFGFIIGVLVATPCRIVASTFLYDGKPQLGLVTTLGCFLGFGSGYLIHQFWNPSELSFVYLTIHSVVVGGVTAAVAAMAKPKWLDSDSDKSTNASA